MIKIDNWTYPNFNNYDEFYPETLPQESIRYSLDGLPEHSHKYYLVSQLTKAYLDTNRKDIKEFLTQVLQEYDEYFAKHSHYGRRAIIE